jgi:cytidylate kinase
MTKKMLSSEKNLIYEAWLSGFIAKDLKGVLKVLLICSHEDIRIDRVVNRENISIEEAKQQIKQREEENFIKWKKLYGNYNFWHPKYFNLIVDTYSAGPMETLGKVLDKLGYKHR